MPGLDGRKMSKSYDNAIYLSDTSAEIMAKIKPMVTDPARKRRTDPGNPDICPVFDLHRIFTTDADREAAATGCRTASIGCLDCKGILLKHMLPPSSWRSCTKARVARGRSRSRPWPRSAPP